MERSAVDTIAIKGFGVNFVGKPHYLIAGFTVHKSPHTYYPQTAKS
jgi:hypothetical protein